MLKTSAPPHPPKLQTLFGEHSSFAWDLLQQQIRLESNPNITGKQIADLLSLYMRAVEKLNSAQDSRELYFKNKVSGLMVRPTVVKAMTATSRKQSEGAEAKQQQGATRNGNDRSHEGTVSTSFYNNLQSKKMEMEMHMTYQTKGIAAKDKLQDMLAQHTFKANSIQQKINDTIDQNKSKVEQRIKQRKLRAYSSRTKSQKTFQPVTQKPQPQNIEVIIEEDQPKNETTSKTNLCMKKRTKKQRWNSLEPKRNGVESPEEVREKVRRRSTIVQLHCRFTLDQ